MMDPLHTKQKKQSTFAGMEADNRKWSIFVQSIPWDLWVTQDAAVGMHEDAMQALRTYPTNWTCWHQLFCPLQKEWMRQGNAYQTNRYFYSFFHRLTKKLHTILFNCHADSPAFWTGLSIVWKVHKHKLHKYSQVHSQLLDYSHKCSC